MRMSGSDYEKRKKLAKLQIIMSLMKKHNITQNKDGDVQYVYSQKSGGGTKVVKKRVKNTSTPKSKNIMSVKINRTSSGKNYQVSFRKKE